MLNLIEVFICIGPNLLQDTNSSVRSVKRCLRNATDTRHAATRVVQHFSFCFFDGSETLHAVRPNA